MSDSKIGEKGGLGVGHVDREIEGCPTLQVTHGREMRITTARRFPPLGQSTFPVQATYIDAFDHRAGR